MTALKNSNSRHFMQLYDSHQSIKPLNKISHIKLQAITRQTSPAPHQRNPIFPRSIERISRKGPHSRSTYIKKIQKGAETNDWTKDDRSREIESASGRRYNRQLFHQMTPIQHKSRQSKSFVIKRKNSSSKRSESFKRIKRPLQNQAGRLKREIAGYAKQNSNRKVEFIINPCETQPQKKQTQNQLLLLSPHQYHQANQQQKMKIAPKKDGDKDSQEFYKYLSQNVRSSHAWQPVVPLPTYKRSPQNDKNVHRLLKKIRNGSKSQLQKNRRSKKTQGVAEDQLRDKNSLKTKTEQTQNKTGKRRIHSGCKTIRVHWGSSQGSSSNQIHNRQTKKQVPKQGQIQISQNMFGGISTICAKTCDSLFNNHSIPTDSLKLIYDQLQRIGPSPPQTVSKQLI